MKFMKLGSKLDAFQSDGKTARSVYRNKSFFVVILFYYALIFLLLDLTLIFLQSGTSSSPSRLKLLYRYVASELPSDVIINVDEVKFHLHKFPLLSKSKYLQRLVSKSSDENVEELQIADFPGGPKAFEICAKFCYGMAVTLNAYNVVAARCAAEFLEMTEDIEKGNLIFKIEVFLNSSIFRSWKDSIIVLQTARSVLPWSEDLKIVGRCVDSIASKTSVDPANITWSYTCNRKLTEPDRIMEDGINFEEKIECVPRDWWVEDICELEIDLYRRVMIAVKSKGRMDGGVIGEALKTYAIRWLPDTVDALVSDVHANRNKSLVETIICLLPPDKGIGCSCSFLLKLLKVSVLVGADESLKEDLVRRVSLKLHEASVRDVLIPALPPKLTRYDDELVQNMVNQYLEHDKCNWDLDAEEKKGKRSHNFLLGHWPLLNVGKLVDGYLGEIADDPNLSLSSFMALSQSIPDTARPIHDGLYNAIDLYLKGHQNLNKAERKKICGLIDVKKLTMEVSMHAAQNERLPLRVIVQVLFFEQVRASTVQQPPNSSRLRPNNDDSGDVQLLAQQTNQMKMSADARKSCKKKSRSGIQLLPSRSRRIFDRIWSVGKAQGESRGSETSGSSHSPTSMLPADMKSSCSSSRHRRHSIS